MQGIRNGVGTARETTKSVKAIKSGSSSLTYSNCITGIVIQGRVKVPITAYMNNIKAPGQLVKVTE